MSSTHSQVVVAYDFSHSGRAALYRAIAVGTRAPFHVLHFVCVIEPHLPLPGIPATHGVDYHYAERVQQALTDEIAQELRAGKVEGRVHFYVHTRIGKPAEEILSLAREVGADLIILGSKGITGIERLVLGSVSEKVVREAGCTVEVARPKTYPFVNLLEIVDAKAPHHAYVRPHRYTYEDHALNVRPTDWPLY
jgi:nucleotide-binding universal stress UspA family protein